MRSCIVIPTFRRPRNLVELLAALPQQNMADCEVVVIDNDSECSAKELVEKIVPTFPVPLHYRVVREPGVSAVRNDALDFASDFDFLIMIDDDEIPELGWLAQLLHVQQTTQAVAVIGPVLGRYPENTNQWAIEGGFFDHRFRVDDCASLPVGHTGNCLIVVKRVKSMGLTFHPGLGTIGGEDTLFFRQLRARGGSIVYAAEAIATETVPATRLCVSWLLRRHLRRGALLSFCDRDMYGRSPVLLVRAGKGVGSIGLGLCLLPVAAVRGKLHGVRALCNIARGIGMLIGLVGVQVHEYRH